MIRLWFHQDIRRTIRYTAAPILYMKTYFVGSRCGARGVPPYLRAGSVNSATIRRPGVSERIVVGIGRVGMHIDRLARTRIYPFALGRACHDRWLIRYRFGASAPAE